MVNYLTESVDQGLSLKKKPGEFLIRFYQLSSISKKMDSVIEISSRKTFCSMSIGM